MSIEIDLENGLITDNGLSTPLYSTDGFEILNQLWLKVGWNQKYSYRYSWLGRPIIQLPEDLLRMQEVIYSIKPDLIIETGIAWGGSLVFYASLCHALGRGRVVGVDIMIKPENKTAILTHPLAPYITLFEGSSTDASIISAIKQSIKATDTVMVILDSNHSYSHVAAELNAYSSLITPGSYIVVTDGYMEDLGNTPPGLPGWRSDNPARAARDFVAGNPAFIFAPPEPLFNESNVTSPPTYWKDAWIKRLS